MDILTLGQVLDILKASPSLDHAILKIEAHLNAEVKADTQVIVGGCKYCGTTENIVYSGVDAVVLGCETYTTCYQCARESAVKA